MNESTPHRTPMRAAPARRIQRLPSQFFVRLVQRADREIAEGSDVINLGQGSPDTPTPPHIVESLQRAAEDPRFHRYPPFDGYAFLKEAIARRYQENHGVSLDPEREVAILFGGKAGLIELAQCLLDPGDVCLVPDPGYPDYRSGIALAGAEAAPMPLRRSNGFLPDYDAIPSRARDRAKLMFVNYPNNPLFGALERIGWRAAPPAGSFFAWLPVPEGFDSSTFADLVLRKAKVVVAPGIGFGRHGEGYVRVGLLAPESRLEEAVERIGKLGLFLPEMRA